MTKRNCYVTDVGIAIEKLADALDPERKPPFKGDILDQLRQEVVDSQTQLEWVNKTYKELKSRVHSQNGYLDQIANLRRELAVATDQIAAAIAACKVKDEALYAIVHGSRPWATSSILEVLAVTPSISEWNTLWQKENDELRQQLAAKQSEVDALMLEYCPSEMSKEQLDNWAAHQRPTEWKTNDELRQQIAVIALKEE